MTDALSFAEIDGQHLELLPARTVLSLFTAGGGPEGGDAEGKAAFFHNWFYTEGDVYNTATGAQGGSADSAATSDGAGVDE